MAYRPGFVLKAIFYLVILWLASVSLTWLWVQSMEFTKNGQPDGRLQFPESLPQVRKLAKVINKDYLPDHRSYTVRLFSAGYLLKQAFSKSGTVYLTILSGQIFKPTDAWLLCSFLQALGSTLCHFASQLFWCTVLRLILLVVSKSCYGIIGKYRRMIQDGQHWLDLMRFIIGWRVFPFTPDFILNIAAPLFGVSARLYFILSLFSSLPSTYFLVKFGSRLHLTDYNSFAEVFFNDPANTWMKFSILIFFSCMVGNPLQMFQTFLGHMMEKLKSEVLTQFPEMADQFARLD